MKHLTKKLLVLITSVLLVSLALSACGIDAMETNDVSDEARENHINSMLYAEGVEILHAPLIEEYKELPTNLPVVSKNDGAKAGITGWAELVSNEKYGLYMDFVTTDIAVLDKTTGNAYHSNPDNDPSQTLSASLQANIASPLILEAYDAVGKRYSFNFYSNCKDDLAYYVARTSDNSIRIIYTIGNDPDKDLFPPVITEGTYENKILQGLYDAYANQVIDAGQYEDYLELLNACYRYMTPKDIDIETKERFKETFPTIDVMTLYVSYDKVTTKQRARIKEMMETIGFTAKDVKREMELADYQGPERSVLYTIPVDLTLTENGLDVSIDTSLILGPNKQRLYTINVYRGFGATAGKHAGSHLIVPDGSGAVIPVSGNLTRDVFKSRIYGSDGSFARAYSSDYSQQVVLPVMIYDRGVAPSTSSAMNGGGLVAILKNGAGQASVVARPVSGTATPVASINFEIVYSERDYRTYSTSVSALSSVDSQTGSGLLLSKEDVEGVYQIQYLFTAGEMDYSDYAAYLRDYFIANDLFPKETLKQTELPLYVDLMGCVDLNQTFLGVPVQTETALTTYKQAAEILAALKEAGVNNVVSRYSYWSNGGEANTAANDLDLMSCMGSKSDLDALVQYCNDSGMGFFPSVDFLHVTEDGNGFSKTNDAARRMNRSTATIVERYNAIGSNRKDLDEKTLVASLASLEMAESYKASFESILNTSGISLGEIGKELHSTYRTNNTRTRMWAEKDHVEILKMYAADYDLMVSTGNFYTWTYADHILGLPSSSTQYLMQSDSIPFVQMLLHGYVNYSLDPLNASGDYETALLLALETGSAFSVRWMGADDSIFDYSVHYNYFSLNYKSTIDRTVAIYKEAASVLNDVLNVPIVEHAKIPAYFPVEHEGLIGWLPVDKDGNVIDENAVVPEGTEKPVIDDFVEALKRVDCDGGVYMTRYGDVKVVIVNYNAFDVELTDRTVVEAKSYKVLTVAEYEAIANGSAYETKPEVPEIPVVPEVPEVPETPETPETPDAPQGGNTTEGGENTQGGTTQGGENAGNGDASTGTDDATKEG